MGGAMVAVKAVGSFLAVASFLVLPGMALAQDPVAATPGIYKVLHENDSVRILELTYQSGQSENWHSHPRYFVYVVEPGKLQVENENGEMHEYDLKLGQHLLTGPITKHRVKNLSDHTVRLISIELKRE
jgi:mannose-6-phosphate isomerase-like protein (cupin superfamily)